MIIATLIILGAALLFVTIAFVAVVFNIVLPMRDELALSKQEQQKQADIIARNAGATVGLYVANCREINKLAGKVAFVEAYTVPVLPEIEKAPPTVRSACRILST
jgi:hypothetical protein